MAGTFVLVIIVLVHSLLPHDFLQHQYPCTQRPFRTYRAVEMYPNTAGADDKVPASTLRMHAAISHVPYYIPAWVSKEHANSLAAPLTSIFNCSLREGVLPTMWNSAHIIPLPKTKPLMSVNIEIRPIYILRQLRRRCSNQL